VLDFLFTLYKEESIHYENRPYSDEFRGVFNNLNHLYIKRYIDDLSDEQYEKLLKLV